MDVLRQHIKSAEGLRLFPYKDTQGHLSIGYGRNLDQCGITEEEAEAMLSRDIMVASDALLRLSIVKHLNHVRRRVCVEMLFNLGLPRFLLFKKMLAAIEAEDWNRAADEMLDSLWAKQVGERAIRLAAEMRIG